LNAAAASRIDERAARRVRIRRRVGQRVSAILDVESFSTGTRRSQGAIDSSDFGKSLRRPIAPTPAPTLPRS
jgi:hypothetical protein